MPTFSPLGSRHCEGSESQTAVMGLSARSHSRHYDGLTSDPAHRLQWHNGGQNTHTACNSPWNRMVSIEFIDARVAARFERYLKSGSGRAFAKRQFG